MVTTVVVVANERVMAVGSDDEEAVKAMVAVARGRRCLEAHV